MSAHVIYGDAHAAERWAFLIHPDFVAIPDRFECEHCQYVREAISAWQKRQDSQPYDSENEGQVHVVDIGWLPPAK